MRGSFLLHLKMKMHSENDSPVLSSGTECTVVLYITVLHCTALYQVPRRADQSCQEALHAQFRDNLSRGERAPLLGCIQELCTLQTSLLYCYKVYIKWRVRIYNSVSFVIIRKNKHNKKNHWMKTSLTCSLENKSAEQAPQHHQN